MAEWVVSPIMNKIVKTCSDYLENQFKLQTGMTKELDRLRENKAKIQAFFFAANQAQISDQNPALKKWTWQLRDAIDEADDLLDELEYMKHKEQLAKITEETKKRKLMSFLFESAHKIRKVGERLLKIDPNLKRLNEAVQKLDKVSADAVTFLHLLENTKQEQKEQEVDFYKTRETGSLPKNDLIGRGKDKEFVMQWLRNPSHEEQQALINGNDLYRNISVLSIVGHSGMGKTTLLQHVYKDEITKEFDPKIWVYVSNNFDVKKVIADMLESLKKKRPRLETLEALQDSLRTEMMSKKFLLVLDNIWENDEKRDKSKWENLLAPLAYGNFGSRILVTTRMDSVAVIIAKIIKKKKEIFRLEGLEEDECLQLLNSHAFADVENPNDHKTLRVIAREIVKKLSGSPLAAKVIGDILNSNLDERHWLTVLENNLLDMIGGRLLHRAKPTIYRGSSSGGDSVRSLNNLSTLVHPNSTGKTQSTEVQQAHKQSFQETSRQVPTTDDGIWLINDQGTPIRRRGRTTCVDIQSMPPETRVHIEVNDNGVPCNVPESILRGSYMGVVARDPVLAPIAFLDWWNKGMEPLKEKKILAKVKWHNYKTCLKEEHWDNRTIEEIMEAIPTGVDPAQWCHLFNQQSLLKDQETEIKNVENAKKNKKQKCLQTMGQVSFVRRQQETARVSDMLVKEGLTPEDGNLKGSERVFKVVTGPEHLGRVQTQGFGVTPIKYFPQSTSSLDINCNGSTLDRFAQLEDQMQMLRNKNRQFMQQYQEQHPPQGSSSMGRNE